MSSNDYHIKESQIRELQEYLKILEKLKEDQNKELSKTTKISKPIALSSLPSNKENLATALLDSSNIQNLLDRCSNLIIRYGKEILP